MSGMDWSWRRPRATRFGALAIAIGLVAGGAAGCGGSDSESEATKAIEKGKEELKKGFTEAEKATKEGLEKSKGQAKKEVRKKIEEGKEEANRAIEEAEKRAEKYGY